MSLTETEKSIHKLSVGMFMEEDTQRERETVSPGWREWTKRPKQQMLHLDYITEMGRLVTGANFITS